MQATHLIWRQVCHSQKGRGGSWQGEGTLRQRKDRNSQGRPLYTRLIQQQWINTAFTSKLRTRDRSMWHACLTGSSKTQFLHLAWAGKSVPWDATDAGCLRTRSRTIFSRCHILSRGSRALWTIRRPNSAVLRLLHGSRALWTIRLPCTSEALQTLWLLRCHSDSGALGGSFHCWTLQAIWSFPLRTVHTSNCRLGSCAVSTNTCHRHSRRWADIQECLQCRKQPFHPGINHNL